LTLKKIYKVFWVENIFFASKETLAIKNPKNEIATAPIDYTI
jgi:hypothetical protein